jgi:hypothetical protein
MACVQYLYAPYFVGGESPAHHVFSRQCCDQVFHRPCAWAAHKKHMHAHVRPPLKRKRRRKSYSLKEKAIAVQQVEQQLKDGLSDYAYEYAAQIGITAGTLSKWRHKAWLFLELCKDPSLRKTEKLIQRDPKFRQAADELYQRFSFRRHVYGIGADGYWLKYQMQSIVKELQPKGWADFKCSNGWLYCFVKRYNISSQMKTDKKSVSVVSRLPLLLSFWSQIQRAQRIGPKMCPDYGHFPPSHIWNIDQLPLAFALNPKRSYNPVNTPCWIVVVGGSGLDKRQASIQLTLRAEGEQLVPPTIVFRGAGRHGENVTQMERDELNKLTNIRWRFQKKAWADGTFCLDHCDSFVQALKEVPGHHMLVLDNLSAQRMDQYREKLMKHGIFPVYTAPGCTDVVQPIDHHVGAYLKKAMQRFYKLELELRLPEWRNYQSNDSLSASRRRILMAQWLNAAWPILKAKAKFIRSAFESTGVLIRLDGSHEIKIRNLPPNLVPRRFSCKVFCVPLCLSPQL